MFDRTSATASGSRFRAWKLIILAALLGATFALSGDTSRAEPDVDVSVTDTEITLSWDVRGSVVFYWHPANGGKTKVETVSGKSHTISALQPDTRYRFFFFQGLYGELYVTTLATAPDPPAPAAQDTTDATPCVPQLPSDAITIAEVTAWRDAHSHKADHVLRWNRVLAALGDNVQATPLPLADSRANENKFMRSRWSRVSRTLDAIENCGVVQDLQATPELSIAAGPDVLEGETLSFSLTASPVPTTPLTVELDIDTTGDFTVWDGTSTITLQTSGIYTLNLASSDDGVDEPNGAVTATISTGTGYTISSSAGTATVTIQDDDDPPLPQVGISSAPASVTEGEDIELTITSTPAPTSDLDVTLTVWATGDFGVSAGQQTVTIPTSGSATVTLATTDDDVDEEDGFVTLEISAGSDYEPAVGTNIRGVAVQDDDLKFARQGQAQDQQVQVTPTISLDQNSDCSSNDTDADGDGDVTTYDVDEDATLSFTLCSTGGNFAGPVKLRVVQGKSVVKGEDPDGTHTVRPHKPTSGPTVTIPEGSIPSGGRFKAVFDVEVAAATSNTSETLEYTIDEARYDQPDTTVQVIVLDGDGYTVGSQRLLTITIKDNDDPPAGFTSCLGNRVSGRDFTSWQAELFRNTLTPYKEDNDRWLRVLLALGEDKRDVPRSALLTPMTSAEIQNRGLMTRPRHDPNFQLPENIWWTRAYNTLKKLEECQAAEEAPQQGQAQDQQVQITPTISLDQNSDCSNNDADADGDSDATTYDVDEDTNLAFTICATGANLPSTVKLRMTSGKEDVVGEDPDGTHWIPALRPTTKQQISRSAFVVWFRHKIAQDLTVTTNTSAMSETLEYKLNDTRYDQPDTTVTVVMLSGDGYTVGSQNRLTITIKDHDEPPAGYSSCFPNRRSGRHFTSWQAEDYRNLTTPFLGDNLLWSRVILALGEPRQDVPGVGQLSPMTSAEIEQLNLTNRSPYNPSHFVTIENSMWKEAYNTLKKLEECNAPSTENAQQSQDDQDAQSITIASQQDAEPDPTPAKRTHDSSKTLMENCEANLAGSNMFTLESFTKQKTLYDYAHAEEAFKRFQAAFGDSSVGAHIIPMTATEAKQLRDRFTPKVGPFKQYHKTHQVEWAQMRDAYNTLVMLNECAAMDFTTPIEPKVSISAHPNAHNTGVTFTVTAFPAPTETLKVPVSLVADSGAVLPQPIVSVDSSGIGTVTITTPDAVSSVTAALGTGDGYLLRDSSTNSATVNIVADSVALTGREPTISITEVSVNGVVDDDLEVTANTGDTVDIVVTADIGLTGIARVGHTADFRGIGKITTSFHRMDGTEITGQPVLGIFLSPEGKGFKRRGLGIWGMSVQKEFIARTVVDKTRPNGSDGTVTFNIEGGFGYLVDPNANEVIINVKASSP